MASTILSTIVEILDFVILLVLVYLVGYLKAKIEAIKIIEEMLADELMDSGDEN